MKKFLHILNTNKIARLLMLGGVVAVVAVIVLLIIAPWKSSAPQEPDDTSPVIQDTAGPDATPGNTPDSDIPTAPETPAPTPRPPANPLTGIAVNVAGETWTEEMSKNRPWAVSIGINYDTSIPSWGVSDADLIIEYELDQMSSRIIAMYQEIAHVPIIGGVRSLRSSSYEITLGYDAIYTHEGGRTYDNVVPAGNPVTQLGTINAASTAVKGYRHNPILDKKLEDRWVVTGENLVNGLPDTFRTEHEDSFKSGMLFTDDGTPEGGEPAEKITVSFSTRVARKTIFTYIPAENVYYVNLLNKDYYDINNDEFLNFTNVIVIKTNTQRHRYNGHTYIDTTTESRPGYYFNGGKYVEITWSRDDVNSPFEYYNLDGTPLELGVGKTYICIVDNDEGFEPLSIG